MVEIVRPRDRDEEWIIASSWRKGIDRRVEMFIMSADEVLRRAEYVEMRELWKGIDNYRRGYCVELKNPSPSGMTAVRRSISASTRSLPKPRSNKASITCASAAEMYR